MQHKHTKHNNANRQLVPPLKKQKQERKIQTKTPERRGETNKQNKKTGGGRQWRVTQRGAITKRGWSRKAKEEAKKSAWTGIRGEHSSHPLSWL